MIHYAPSLTIINYSVIFIFLVAVALAAIDLSHTRGAPPSNARENEDVWDRSMSL